MERCLWCQGSLDPATQRCQQCGRLPEEPPAQTPATGPETSYLQLGLGRGVSYLDLDLEIGQGQQGVYPLLVLRSPAGATTGQLRWPFAVAEFQQTLLELQNALLRASQPHRQVLSPEAQTVQRFGQRLFEALFVGEVRHRYLLSQQEATQQGKGLRLRLHLLASDLAVVPWEYLYDPAQGDYLCLSRTTPIVRYLERQEARQPLPVTFPLRMLVLIANPSDQEALDTQSEQQRVEAALRRLRERGLVELVWLKGHTWRDLQRAMRGGPWHIFHFIGHGGFDRQADEGVLALENEDGKTHLLRATELARLLATQQSLRLVLLNACEGARASIQDRFSSTAATLARRNIPAVVAMQYAITDRAATEWTRAFYEAVADGLPLDAAVAEARTAISLAVPHTLEWGTPVLYLQAPDGVLFRLPGTSRPLPAAPVQTREQGLAAAEAAQPAGRAQEERAADDEARWLVPNDPAAAPAPPLEPTIAIPSERSPGGAPVILDPTLSKAALSAAGSLSTSSPLFASGEWLAPTGASSSVVPHPATLFPGRLSRRKVVVSLMSLGGLAVASASLAAVLSKGAIKGSAASSPLPSVSPQGTGGHITYRGHTKAVSAVDWSPDGKHIVSGSADATVQVWEATSGKPLITYRGQAGMVTAAKWAPNGARIASGNEDGTVHVWDALTGNHVLIYNRHSKAVTSVSWSPDSKFIVSGSEDLTVQVWDAMTGQTLLTYQGHVGFLDSIVTAVAWSPNDTWIASSDNEEVQVWKADSGNRLTFYHGHETFQNTINAVAWSPDSKLIVSGANDQTVQVWNSTTGEMLLTYHGHSIDVLSVAWSPSGKHIASSDFAGVVRVWDSQTGDDLFIYRNHAHGVTSVAWSPNGQYIASGGYDMTVQIWLP